jgi:hypothetical protein
LKREQQMEHTAQLGDAQGRAVGLAPKWQPGSIEVPWKRRTTFAWFLLCGATRAHQQRV